MSVSGFSGVGPALSSCLARGGPIVERERPRAKGIRWIDQRRWSFSRGLRLCVSPPADAETTKTQPPHPRRRHPRRRKWLRPGRRRVQPPQPPYPRRRRRHPCRRKWLRPGRRRVQPPQPPYPRRRRRHPRRRKWLRPRRRRVQPPMLRPTPSVGRQPEA